ncbi:TPA: hypothetical protein PMB21_001260 [Vibrio cholerae]|uniref:HNH nuclease domain-containing protein n=1 Tax=Vibrio metoecus TaxID=1481663 RepID=A0ABR4RY03_VIBMT|nr:hypothetical protein [Vibrio cholerae]EJL6622066.1 hypothetical protein [Vibrio cholerae]KDO14592.1 hypothetical protein DP83_07150 [Vibrio metoecus]HDI3132588.1 hypothetical protein [Vibrio cholerae]
MTSSVLGEIKHLNSSILSDESAWSWSDQVALSSLKSPDILIGARRDLLQGDISREWVKWIVEQFIDHKYINSEYSYVSIYGDVHDSVSRLVGLQVHEEEKREIVSKISDLVIDRVKLLKKEWSRKPITLNVKEELLEIYSIDNRVRCWLTGYEFSKEAIYNFQSPKSEHLSLKLPEYVDRIKPIGLKSNDIRIEVDHLYPYSLGGEDSIDNYRLICGWANRVKSNHISGYSPGNRLSQKNGIWPKSYYYWLIRLIGLRRRCEHPGCDRNLGNSELTVESAFGSSKALTPASMKVVCYQHSSLENRFIRRKDFTDSSFGSYYNDFKAL